MMIQSSTVSLAFVPRHVIRGTALGLLVLALALLSLHHGAYPLGIADMGRILAGGGSEIERMILLDHRLPRILTGLGAGMAFGLSGAIFQTMLRNPLASPDVIGFTAGAGLGALSALLLTGGAVLVGALTGGALAAALVALLAWQGGLHPLRLILVGIGVSLTLSALSDLVMSRLDVQVAAEMAKWLVGTLNARAWADVALIWAGLALLAPALWALHFPLARLAMADDIAIGLGLPLTRLRLILTGCGVALVGLAVAVAGPLPFVAFVSGPIARRIFSPGSPALLGAGAVGALVVLLADLAARSVPLMQLPAGIFTAIIGAPVLIWLLMIQFRKDRL